MKTAVIAASSIPSSTANSIQVMKVCQALTQNGNTVCLWVPGKSIRQDWVTLAAHYGISTPFEIRRVHSLPVWRGYDLAWNALHAAQHWGADLAYTWMAQTAVLALWQKMPVILEVHMYPGGRLGPWLFRQFLRSSGKKRLLVITDALRRGLERRFGVALTPGEVQVAPMGSEPERYADLPDAAAAREQLGLPQGFSAGYTGHFYPGRGMDLLLDLARMEPQVNFLWIGGRAQDIIYWKEHLASAGIRNVTLTGFIENRRLPLYQAAADVLLMPYEASIGVSSGGDTAEVCSPMKLFDYLSAGRPIISSDLPVLHEVLNAGNALFCPPQDTAAWQHALETLQADSTRRQQLAAQAKADALHYTWRSRSEQALEGFGDED